MRSARCDCDVSKKSRVTKEAKACSMFVDQAIEDDQTTMKLSKGMAKTENVAVPALFLTLDLCKEGIVHMVQVWL